MSFDYEQIDRLSACRHCHRLAYASQNETRSLRAIRRVRKIRMRLAQLESQLLVRMCQVFMLRVGHG
jgi:hypothetical protein